ncbi:MAG: FkbM family methyltransferase [Verrucomicrobiota bacterium]|nr:FkbM family methyltransferase [Verrucomicrobiota bacterium]
MTIKAWAGKRGWAARHFSIPRAANRLEEICEARGRYERLWFLLGDEYSRRILLDVLTFRILGPRHARMRLNTDQFWADCADDQRRARGVEELLIGSRWRLVKTGVLGRERQLHVYSPVGGARHVFGLRPYDYRRGGVTVRVLPEDIIVEGGACWGDTALDFADQAGTKGRVYSFEIDPENLDVLKKNVEMNPEIGRRIHVIERAMGEVSDKDVAFAPAGPGTRLAGQGDPATLSVKTLSVDDLVSRHDLSRVDFIKMDIEGSEMQALRGAQRTLLRFKPRLAISAYHKEEDILTIPEYLDGLQAGYSFYFDHFSVHGQETILFASARPQ